MLEAKQQNFFSFSSLSWLFLSMVIVAFGQPAWIPFLGILAGIIGYALFWRSMLFLHSKRQKFCLAFLWFSGTQLVQLSWMTSTIYQGDYIYLIYFLLIAWLSCQFALLSLCIPEKRDWTLLRVLFIAALWTLMEWARLFLLSGFAFNPSGMALTTNLYSLQFASLFGIYGLSFWVILVNLLALRFLLQRPLRVKYVSIWLTFAALPYLFGFLHVSYHQSQMEQMDDTRNLSALMVQTALSPGEKWGLGVIDNMIYPLHQWQRMLVLLSQYTDQNVDLIVFPESAVPFSAYIPAYTLDMLKLSFKKIWQVENFDFLPHLGEPFSKKAILDDTEVWMVTNAFWAQSLSNYFDADVIIGLEDEEETALSGINNFTSAFNFTPFQSKAERYDKRILMPIVEYLPFEWCKKLAKHYGIRGWFEEGTAAKIFHGEVVMGASVCIEEIFGHLMRDNRLLGAELFVNVTNDVWFPYSSLPEQHFYHGRVRSVENGVPLIRACNTGVTAAVDSLGRTLATFTANPRESEWQAGVLPVTLAIYTYNTLYTIVGDTLIVGFSALIVVIYLAFLVWKWKRSGRS